MRALCTQERAAWGAGDASRAKALRLEEHRFLGTAEAEGATRFGRRLLASDGDGLYGAVAGILLELLRAESGGDRVASDVRRVFGDGGA
jgi:hypothetical protein